MFSLLSKIYCPIKKGRFEANSSFITQISMTPGKLNVKITSENHREFIRKASKILHEWNGHLEICSRRQAAICLRTDVLQQCFCVSALFSLVFAFGKLG